MECRTVAGMLSEYVESLEGKRSALTANEQKAIATHLQKCAGCRGLQGELQEIRLAARELPVHTPPASLWTRIANQIEIEQAGTQAKAPGGASSVAPSWWERLRRQTFIFSLPQMAGAGALALILLSVTIYQLNKIEASLKQCQEQLASNPNDLTQVQKMLDLYEEKRQLLEDVERLN